VPSHNDLRETSLRLEFRDGLCSGTAISADTLLSAKHCFTGPLKTVNGRAVTVVDSHTESRDRIVVKVAGIRFKSWAKRGPMPLQGDTLRFWGVPQGEPDVYREVIVSRARTDQLVLQGVICPGDSGAGLVDAQGRVVGVVSAMTGDRVCRFGLSL
jgi:V8-like Glu-specific endopeptidase